jgi:hypothetical protein
MNGFKSFNPKYKIDLIHYSKNDIINSHDSVLNYCKDLIFKANKGIKCKYFYYIRERIKSKFNFIQILSDVIRFEILYYYGGIYLDCDTFPVKSFDDNLLSMNSFSQSVLCFRNKLAKTCTYSDDIIDYYDLNFTQDNLIKYHCFEYTDIYFFGLCKEYTSNDVVFKETAYFKHPLMPAWIRNFDNTDRFNYLKNKFYNCDISLVKDEIFYSHYINHFCNKKWQTHYKKSSMYCEYDDELYDEGNIVNDYISK